MSDTGDSVHKAPPKAPPKGAVKKKVRKAAPDTKQALRGTGEILEAQESQRKTAESAALAYLAKKQAATRKRKADVEVGKQWFVICRYCQGPAIWLVGKVKTWLNASNWHSSYKAIGVEWPSVDIYCQCCMASGAGRRKVSVNKDARHTVCIPKPQLIRSMPQAEYDELMAGAVEEVS